MTPTDHDLELERRREQLYDAQDEIKKLQKQVEELKEQVEINRKIDDGVVLSMLEAELDKLKILNPTDELQKLDNDNLVDKFQTVVRYYLRH